MAARDGDGSPPRSAWKYAWGPDQTPGTAGSRRNGQQASDRLYQSAKSSRQAREALQRSLQAEKKEDPRVPRANARSRVLAADRYDKVMGHTVTGRYRKEALAIAKAKGQDSALIRDVYNYGDMLFQEAQMTRSRREEWRREQLKQRIAAEDAEATFQPEISPGTQGLLGWGGEIEHEEVLTRFERQAAIQKEKQLALAEHIRQEEARDLTFKPQGQSAKSKRLMEGYGDVLEEMRAREEERALRLRQLVDRAEAESRANHGGAYLPSGARKDSYSTWPQAPLSGRSTSPTRSARSSTSPSVAEAAGAPSAEADAERSPPPKASAEAAAPAPPAASVSGGSQTRFGESYSACCHRLHTTHTSSYQQSLLPPTTGDPECTFHPNLNPPSARLGGGSSSVFSNGHAAEISGVSRLSSRAALEEVSDALYQDAHNRSLRRQMLEAQAEAEAFELRNAPKISRQSERYALKKLERDVVEIYAALDKEHGGLDYEEFAAAMVELGFLRFVDAADGSLGHGADGGASSACSSSSAGRLSSLQQQAHARQSGSEGTGVAAKRRAEGGGQEGGGQEGGPQDATMSKQPQPTPPPQQRAAGQQSSAEPADSHHPQQHIHLREEVLLVQRVWAALVGYSKRPTAFALATGVATPADGKLSCATFLAFLNRALAANPPPFRRADEAQSGAPVSSYKDYVDVSDGEPSSPPLGDGPGGDARNGATEEAVEAAVQEMEELCSQFATMHRSTLAYKPTRNVKGAIVDEAGNPLGTSSQLDHDREMDHCTFAPAINAKSVKLEEERRAAAAAVRAAAQAAADADAEDFAAASAAYAAAAAAAAALNPSIGGGSGIPPPVARRGGRHLALYEHAAGIEARRAQKRAEAASAKMHECTFKPSLSEQTMRILEAHGNEPLGTERFRHLHEQANSRQHSERQLPPSTADREAAECTFKPVLETANYRPRTSKQRGGGGGGGGGEEDERARPAGYQQAVSRLRRASEERAAESAEAEREARRRAALAGKPAQPFHLETEARSVRRHPLLYMDVNLGPGKTGRIGLHGDDDPAALAANFARAYGLDAAMQTKLEGLIERYLREVVPGLATARNGAASPGEVLRSPPSGATPSS